jgi:hypothetical protein
MKIAHHVASNERLRQESAWQLLAADTAPIVVALLQSHLFERERSLSGSILHERLNRDLELLRAEGRNLGPSAQAYLRQWVSEGYLERCYDPGAGEEAYKLSAAGLQAIRFVESLTQKRTSATESRLSLVIQQLVQLVEQTDRDPESRARHLLRERARIDAEIEALRGGRLETLPEDRALERAREIIALADDLANDFRRVREEFQQLNIQIWAQNTPRDGTGAQRPFRRAEISRPRSGPACQPLSCSALYSRNSSSP